MSITIGDLVGGGTSTGKTLRAEVCYTTSVIEYWAGEEGRLKMIKVAIAYNSGALPALVYMGSLFPALKEAATKGFILKLQNARYVASFSYSKHLQL